MFVYYSSAQAVTETSEDQIFAVLDVDGRRERLGWVVWRRMGVTGCNCGTAIVLH